MSERTRVLFIIQSLASGGAERQLCELVRNMDHSRFEVHVTTFYDPGYHNDGKFWGIIAEKPEVTLHSLHKRKGVLGFVRAIPRLFRLVWRIRPHVLHGYSDGNLLALIAGWFFGARIVWGIRRSSSDRSKLDDRAKKMQRWLIRRSHKVDLIIFNSEAGKANYLAMGMRPKGVRVIPNGFDVSRFSVDPEQGLEWRRASGVPEGAPLIGIVGRLSPVKDHPTFLRAAARIAKEFPEARFVCVGHGPDHYLATLQNTAKELGVSDRILWPGGIAYMPPVYNAMSALVLSSTDEGFPNVIGEAMACGVPAVATRVGDAAMLIGDTGIVVNVGDDAAIAEGVSRLLREPEADRKVRAEQARSRVCTMFSVPALVNHTQDALLGLLHPEAPALPAQEA